MSKRASNLAKGFAIILMLMHHMFISVDDVTRRAAGAPINAFPFSLKGATFLGFNLKICVAVFVFVTGYGMYKQVLAKGLIGEGSTAARP